MTQQSNALTVHVPRAVERQVERQIDHMKAKEAVGKSVIDSGLAVHDHGSKAILEAAQLDHLMLQAMAPVLNGSAADVEESIRQLSSIHREFVFQYVRQHMASALRQAEAMPDQPVAGFLARLGDGIAEAQDELRRLQAGG